MPARTAVVVGNPKPASRTLTAAVHVARELAGRDPDLVVDLAEEVGRADLVVVASPTYGPVDTRFEGLAVTTTGDGAVTLDDGLARFDCSIFQEVEAGDHTVVLLRLHAVEHADTSMPLVFHRSAFGRLAG